MSATITLPRALADNLARALSHTTSQLEILIDPGVVTQEVYAHARGVLTTFHYALADGEVQTAESLPPHAAGACTAETLDSALEIFGGPLRLAVLGIRGSGRVSCTDALTAQGIQGIRGSNRVIGHFPNIHAGPH